MSMGFFGGLSAWINAHAVWPHLPFWAYAVITLIDTHITTTCVSLYLHRCQTHRAIAFAAPVEHLMRFWLWVRTAMPTKEWVAVHRCHHAYVETDKDPHSPIVYGIWRVLFLGTGLYHRAAHNQQIVEQFGKGTPDDFLEFFYDRLAIAGPVLTLLTNLAVRYRRHLHVAGGDGVDSVLCGRRDQRPRPLLGLSQFRDSGCVDQLEGGLLVAADGW